MFPALAQAGEWCLVRDENERCAFSTADACYETATRGGGYCRPNYRDAGVAGDKAWCVISATMRRCTYYFKPSCVTAARRLDGACVANTEQLIQQAGLRQKFGGYDISAKDSCKGDISCEARQAARAAQQEGE